MQGTYQLSASDLTVKLLIEKKLQKQAIVDSFFSRYMGKDSNSLVQVKTNNEGRGGGKGELFTIRKKLQGKGVTGRQRLEGKEEGIVKSSFSTSLEIYRHATQVEEGLTAQYDEFDIPQEAQDALKDWMTEKIDDLCFETIYANHTNVFYGGTASSVGTLAAGDKITPTLLRKMRVRAETGNGRKMNPLMPVKYKGKPYWFVLMHPEQIFDLKEDSTMQQYLINAMPRSEFDNPIFTGAEFIFDGLVLLSHERVFNADDGGAGAVPYAKALVMGAQSLLWTWGKRPKIIPKTDDYDMWSNFAIEMIAHADKPKFDSVDYNSMVVITSRSQVNS